MSGTETASEWEDKEEAAATQRAQATPSGTIRTSNKWDTPRRLPGETPRRSRWDLTPSAGGVQSTPSRFTGVGGDNAGRWSTPVGASMMGATPTPSQSRFG